ncbi:MAG: hypothetical protein GY850_07635 [bacterium]|nr:hypothetical protein [bacterium]
MTVYLPPEDQGTGTEDGPGKDSSPDQRKKLAETAAAIQAGEDAKATLGPQKK